MWGHMKIGKYPPVIYIKILEIVRFARGRIIILNKETTI